MVVWQWCCTGLCGVQGHVVVVVGCQEGSTSTEVVPEACFQPQHLGEGEEIVLSRVIGVSHTSHLPLAR